MRRDVPPTARAEIDAGALGVRANAAEDQSAALQRAIERAAAAGAVLRLPPGIYRVGALQLPSHAALAGVAGATRLVMTGGPSMLSATGSDHVSLSGLVLDGANIPLADGRGLVHLAQGRAVRITDCEIVDAGRNGVTLEAIAGEVAGNTVNNAADYAIFSNDAAGLRIAGNTVRGAGNGGILVWRSKAGDDGTLVVDNRVENIRNNRAAPGNGATPSMFFARTMSSCAAIASATPRSRPCAAMPRPTFRSSATPVPASARSRCFPSSASRAR